MKRIAKCKLLVFRTLSALSALAISPAVAQIVPDDTLGSESSVVRSNANVNGLPSDHIEGGALRGELLFHSFEEFNVVEGHGAYFANPAAVNTIFSRVTGANPSEILGTLGVLGDADLVFINPNGILFGPNARLDLRGSFTASTASDVEFSNGELFSKLTTTTPPSLIINIDAPIGLIFEGERSNPVVNAGELKVETGQSLALLAGTVISTGSLVAPAGNVDLISVSEEALLRTHSFEVFTNHLSSDVDSTNTSNSSNSSIDSDSVFTDSQIDEIVGLPATFATPGNTIISGSIDVSENTGIGGNVQIFGEEVFLLNADIDASGTFGGGRILIGGDFQGQGEFPNARQTFISTDSSISADAAFRGNGGLIIVWSDEATDFYGDITTHGGTVSGDGGFVEVSGRESLVFSGNVDTRAANGLPGTLLLDPKDIVILNGAGDSSNNGNSTFQRNTSNQPGSILHSNINDAAPTVIYESDLEELSGNTNIILQATNDITVEDLLDNNLDFAAGSGFIILQADADLNGTGSFEMLGSSTDTVRTNGRDIQISGANLYIGGIDTSNSTVVNVDSGGRIPPTGTRGQSIYTITVPEQLGEIVDLNVRFSAEHTYVRDLAVSLESPEGSNITLFSRVGSFGDDFQETVLDDQAQVNISRENSPFAGKFRPEGDASLADFNGQDASGIWFLTVSDEASGDDGYLFRSGDNAPWGTAIGTQLILTTSSSTTGSVALNATNEIVLEDFSSISASGNVSEDIQIRSSILTLGENSSIISDSFGDKDGGSIDINVDRLSLQEGAFVATSTSGSGRGGALRVQASESVSLIGQGFRDLNINFLVPGLSADLSLFDRSSGLYTGTSASGSSGSIEIISPTVELFDGARIFSPTFSDGNGGDISIGRIDSPATLVRINSSSLATSTLPIGNNLSTFGNAGNLSIYTEQLQLEEGGTLISSTLSNGLGGDIFIDSYQEIIGTGISQARINSEFAVIPTGIFTNTLSPIPQENQADAGDITIETGLLSLNGGASISSASGAGTRFGIFRGRGDGGNISVAADTARFSGGIVINGVTIPTGIDTDVATSDSVGNAGNIEVTISEGLLLTSGASISAATEGEGNAGLIDLNIQGTLELDGVSQSFSAEEETSEPFLGISAIRSTVEQSAVGSSQGINIRAGSVSIANGAVIASATLGDGNAGNIEIFSDSVRILGDSNLSSRILASAANTASNSSRGGGISVNSPLIQIAGTGSGLFAEAEGAAGAGSLTLSPLAEGTKLTVNLDDSEITATTLGGGQGGRIEIQAPQSVTLSGTGVISSEVFGSGMGGGIEIETSSLTISSGLRVSTTANPSASASTRGGSLTVIADSIGFSGNGSGLFAQTLGNASAGDINLLPGNNGNLTISSSSQGPQISASTLGIGAGGNINIRSTEVVSLFNTKVETDTFGAGLAGSIFVEDFGTLLLRNGSLLQANAGGNADGGNITFNGKFIIAVPQENSDITANAFEGNGGRVEIFADGLFGLEFRDELTPYSDITANSQLGNPGIVTINTLDVDPNQGLATLPEEPRDIEIADSCQQNPSQNRAALFNLGQGGTPPNPDSMHSANADLVGWVSLDLAELPLNSQNTNASTASNATVSESATFTAVPYTLTFSPVYVSRQLRVTCHAN